MQFTKLKPFTTELVSADFIGEVSGSSSIDSIILSAIIIFVFVACESLSACQSSIKGISAKSWEHQETVINRILWPWRHWSRAWNRFFSDLTHKPSSADFEGRPRFFLCGTSSALEKIKWELGNTPSRGEGFSALLLLLFLVLLLSGRASKSIAKSASASSCNCSSFGSGRGLSVSST